VKSYFDSNNLTYYTFFPKTENLVKAVVRNLQQNNHAEDISDGLVSPVFEVTSAKQGSLFQIITFIEPKATRAEKAELLLQLENSFPSIM
jgi:hypothetical protein